MNYVGGLPGWIVAPAAYYCNLYLYGRFFVRTSIFEFFSLVFLERIIIDPLIPVIRGVEFRSFLNEKGGKRI